MTREDFKFNLERCGYMHYDGKIWYEEGDLIKCFEDVGALEQEPSRKGHWIEKEDFNGDTYYDCSECGESFCLMEGTPTDNLYNYCPNCGCRMVGDTE